MAIYGHMNKPRRASKRGQPCHIYLDNEQELLLDAISIAKGKRRLDVKATRSQLISTAVRNFIIDCREEEDLRVAVDDALKTISERETAQDIKVSLDRHSSES